jgi:hypothetical protein
MTIKHKPATPLPWFENWNNPQDGWIEGQSQQVVVLTGVQDGQDQDDADKDAAYIAHAANAYPKLVRALYNIQRDVRTRQDIEDARDLLRELGEA